MDSVRAAIRTAIVGLKQLDDDLASEIRRRSRPVEAGAGMLSDAELSSLEANVRYQLARGFRNQALSYPPDSNDRINAFTQAIELLTPLGKSPDDDPLAWPSRVEEIVCLRQVGKLAEATHRLADLESATPPLASMRRLRTEGVRLLVAKGRLSEALAAAGPPIDDDEPGAAELDFARLEALVALWQRAGGAAGDPLPRPEAAGAEAEAEKPAADWQQQATAQVQHIEKVHGAYWMRRAETLLAESLAAGGAQRPAGTPGNLDGLVRAAASYWRAGQADEALATYDQAAKAAVEGGNAEKAFELGMTAAGIQNQRKQFRDARRRFHELAATMPSHRRAAEADLAAIYDQAAAAAAEGKSQDPQVLAEYRQMLENHLTAWPQSPTSGQVAWWLGRLDRARRPAWAAVAAFRRVPPEHPQYAAAVEAAATAYQRLLDQARAAGKPDQQLARQAVDWLRQVIIESSGKSDAGLALARQAVLSAARISISDLPGGAADAEDMLKQALAEGAKAPGDWQVAARLLLVSALAQRQRYDEAAEVLKQGAAGSPNDLLALLERLNQATGRAKPSERPTLIRLEQQTLAELDAQKPRFDDAAQQRLQVARLQTLIDAGQGQSALALAETLAKKYPDDGSVQEDYARLLGRSTDPAQLRLAFARWREVAERSRPGTPRWLHAQLGLAQAQLALGNRAQARTIVKIVEAGYPDFCPGGRRKRCRAACSVSRRVGPRRKTVTRRQTAAGYAAPSLNQLADRLVLIAEELRAAAEIGKRGLDRVDAHAVIERGEHFQVVDRPILHLAADAIARSDNLAGPHAAAGQHGEVDRGPMIAAGIFVDLGRAAEFAPHDHRHVLFHSPLVQVIEQRRNPLIEHRNVLPPGGEILPVPIPTAEGTGDATGAGFDQPPGHEEMLHQLRAAVVPVLGIAVAIPLADCRILALDVEGFHQPLRSQHVEGLLVEPVEAFHHAARIGIAAEAIETGQKRLAIVQPIERNAVENHIGPPLADRGLEGAVRDSQKTGRARIGPFHVPHPGRQPDERRHRRMGRAHATWPRPNQSRASRREPGCG